MPVHKVRPDISVLNDSLEVPGIGHLPVNSFVLHASQPVVIDTGLGLPDRNFLELVASVLDPVDVRWIWLTHPDRDHTGGIFDLLAAAPEARVVTTFLSVGYLSCERPLPLDRLYLINPGQTLDVGDRTLMGFRPPLFDNPGTVGFFDDRSGACFSSDCFGGPMPSAELARADDVSAVGEEDLRAAQLLWATVDSPWVQNVDAQKFVGSFQPLREREPELILSTHLPPAPGITGAMIDRLGSAAGAPAFVGPDQAALEQMLAGFEPSGGGHQPAPGTPG
ncbi:glyoxylase-like metal-dependent hydrolase (beta-lactamase superfamily II) [Streptomyces africanus]|uniref:Glyoxylase-like metal-dependent hydrolase (Beta-lactamase superfamily II) n=1 Tax=Streptomyces africanus TaxID=231024 RepID=A0ABU0QEP2_9ACTN|nr:MBL fold metallo-hydrolase [Streptomyces africanus]MDQ0745858.1 glyoxylase-like metal-dependent hydrolase (beta-lactamase superfamily II) [Streptomyces africanus]